MKYDIITIGGATEDINFFTSEGKLIKNKKDPLRQELLAFEYGAKIKINKAISTFGGGAANAAVCFSRLDFKVGILTIIGQDERGKRILNNFKKNKIKIKLVEASSNLPTAFSFLLISDKYSKEHIVFSSRGANNQLKITNFALKNLAKTRWIYLTSLSGAPILWEENLAKIFSVSGPKIAWNPGGRQLSEGVKVLGAYLAKTEVLILNQDEALELVLSQNKKAKAKPKKLPTARELVKNLLALGPKIAVITCGKKGAYAGYGKKIYFQKALKEKRRLDTTGVGDAFGASFVAGLDIYSGDIQKALQLGARNTASVIAEIGAQNGLIKI